MPPPQQEVELPEAEPQVPVPWEAELQVPVQSEVWRPEPVRPVAELQDAAQRELGPREAWPLPVWAEGLPLQLP